MNEKPVEKNLNTFGIKILVCLLFVFACFNQNAFSQEEKKEGVKLSQVKAVYKSQNSALPIGNFRHPTKAIWVRFNRDKKVFQCRISNDGWVYKSQGTLEDDNKVVWANFWTKSKITKKKDKIILKSKNEKVELIWVNRISNNDCSSPIPYRVEIKTSSGGIGNGIGTGSGIGNGLSDKPTSGVGSGSGGVGEGRGSGVGRGSGSGSGVGSGRGGGIGSGDISPMPKSSLTRIKGPTTSLKILSKPKPSYTDAARRNNVQGMVKLRVTFLANGKIGGVAPVTGLPHGLTQKAIAAAKQIQFKPPTRNGVPYSVTKLVAFYFTIY